MFFIDLALPIERQDPLSTPSLSFGTLPLLGPFFYPIPQYFKVFLQYPPSQVLSLHTFFLPGTTKIAENTAATHLGYLPHIYRYQKN